MTMRNDFPIFEHNPELLYFDSAATTQKPKVVIEAMDKYYREFNANTHRSSYGLAEKSTRAYEAGREAVAKFLGARDAREIVFTKGATEALNLLANGMMGSILEKGDLVLLSVAEHHANMLPWLRLKELLGIELEFVQLDEFGGFDWTDFARKLALKPKVVSLSALSNVLGEIIDLPRLLEMTKQISAVTVLDACQSLSRLPMNVGELGVDFVVGSGHKLYGPMGIGFLYGRMDLLQKLAPLNFGGGMIDDVRLEGGELQMDLADVPMRFEGGTQNVAGVVGLHAALDYLSAIGMDNILEHEQKIYTKVWQGLEKIAGLRILGSRDLANRAGVLAFVVDGVSPFDLSKFLDLGHQIAIRSGHHCCSPLMSSLGVSATSRISFGLYNSEAEAERLIAGIEAVVDQFRG